MQLMILKIIADKTLHVIAMLRIMLAIINNTPQQKKIKAKSN
jgi:hypothetical protein